MLDQTPNSLKLSATQCLAFIRVAQDSLNSIFIGTGDLPAEFRDQAATTASDWLAALEQEAERRLARGDTGILDALGRQFERALISKALARTGGRRIEAANLLGMGRNTITRKIQELGIEDDKSGSDPD